MGAKHGIKVATDRQGRISLARVVARWAHLYLAEELPNGTITLTPLPPASEKVKPGSGQSIRAVSGGYWTSLLYAFRSTISLTDSEVTLTAWGQLLQALLRLTGPVLLGLALLALRGRVKR
jgi:hypothetical protein